MSKVFEERLNPEQLEEMFRSDGKMFRVFGQSEVGKWFYL